MASSSQKVETEAIEEKVMDLSYKRRNSVETPSPHNSDSHESSSALDVEKRPTSIFVDDGAFQSRLRNIKKERTAHAQKRPASPPTQQFPFDPQQYRNSGSIPNLSVNRFYLEDPYVALHAFYMSQYNFPHFNISSVRFPTQPSQQPPQQLSPPMMMQAKRAHTTYTPSPPITDFSNVSQLASPPITSAVNTGHQDESSRSMADSPPTESELSYDSRAEPNNNNRNSTNQNGEVKDSAYLEKRKKNNIAAKKSRDRRRQKGEELLQKTNEIKRDIELLRAHNAILRTAHKMVMDLGNNIAANQITTPQSTAPQN